MSLAAAMAITVGLHMGSTHVPDRDGQNNTNPGIYVRADQVVVGTYKNSFSRTTYYAGYAYPLGAGFEVMGGLATGYRRLCETTSTDTFTGSATITRTETRCRGISRGPIAPLAGLTYAPETRWHGLRPRVWFIPGIKDHSSVFHLSIEADL